MIFIYYFSIKLVFFYSLVRALVKFELLQDRVVFLGILYTAGVALLSFVFITSWQTVTWAAWALRVGQVLGVHPQVAWLGATLLLSTFYFWLLAKFDEGVLFWTLLLLGVFVVLF
jgi:hypothetical protein